MNTRPASQFLVLYPVSLLAEDNAVFHPCGTSLAAGVSTLLPGRKTAPAD